MDTCLSQKTPQGLQRQRGRGRRPQTDAPHDRLEPRPPEPSHRPRPLQFYHPFSRAHSGALRAGGQRWPLSWACVVCAHVCEHGVYGCGHVCSMFLRLLSGRQVWLGWPRAAGLLPFLHHQPAGPWAAPSPQHQTALPSTGIAVPFSAPWAPGHSGHGCPCWLLPGPLAARVKGTPRWLRRGRSEQAALSHFPGRLHLTPQT